MAAIFTSFVGTSRAFETQGTSPGRFKVGSQVQTADWTVSGRLKDIANDALDYWGSKANDLIDSAVDYLRSKGEDLDSGDVKEALEAGINPGTAILKLLAANGFFDRGEAADIPSYRNSKGSAPRYWDARADKGLSEIMADLGIITSIAGGFKEDAKEKGTKVDSGSKMLLGTAVISGIAFEVSCDRNTSRHGLEAILEFYAHHRVGNEKKPMTIITIGIGETQLKGWLVKLDWRPMNLDFNLWSWDLTLLVDPEYVPKPISGNVPGAARGGGNRAAAEASGSPTIG